MNAEIIRLLLALVMIGMALLALFYMRQRKLTGWQTTRFALLAICVPLLGPFLVIICQPGKPRHPS
jgi:heme/copper-type cytochrome/quinol oxidase subunit 4